MIPRHEATLLSTMNTSSIENAQIHGAHVKVSFSGLEHEDGLVNVEIL